MKRTKTREKQRQPERKDVKVLDDKQLENTTGGSGGGGNYHTPCGGGGGGNYL